VQGRITERQLPLAEESFPGIGRFYRDLSAKPLTFLQLVWMYEAQNLASQKRARPARRTRR
jgi:hypothetical protein